jgi:nucleolar protein 56
MELNDYKFLILELGIVILDNENTVVYFKKFENPHDSHLRLKDNNYSDLKECLEFFSEKPVAIATNYPAAMSFLGAASENVQRISTSDEKAFQIGKLNLYQSSPEFSNDSDNTQKSLFLELRDFSLAWSSLKIQEASQQLDLHISQSINGLDEIDKILNTVGTRMREWYGLHFPELDNLLQNIVTYAQIVSQAGRRDNITKDFLATLDIPDNRIDIIIQTSLRSKGGKITDENLIILQSLANQVISLNQIRKNLEQHVESAMEEVAPNLRELLTASVGARLIAKAGSLKRLASLSSSTIQILGAEKALFRTLKTGANPPKHGLLFQHPVIHSAPKWQRGKLARAISAKAAIAARVDFFNHNVETTNLLRTKLNNRILEIQEKYKEPSPSQINRFKQVEQPKKSSNFKHFNRKKDKSFNKNLHGEYQTNQSREREFSFKKNKSNKRHHKSNKK